MPAADRFISDNSIETVELAVVDIMGAIRGKRIPAPVFLQGTEFAMPSGVFCIDYGLDMLQTGEYSWAGLSVPPDRAGSSASRRTRPRRRDSTRGSAWGPSSTCSTRTEDRDTS
jgi:hypothetical protein